MPRSKVRPNISTYHEAIFMVLEADGSFPGVPLTKAEDKFTTKGIAYLAGRFGLPITTTIQDLYKEVVATYGLPDGFLTRIRAMQQLYKGVEIPASYGTLEDNVLAVTKITDHIREVVSGYEDDDFVIDEEVYGGDLGQLTEDDAPADDPESAAFDEAARRKAYEELAAANPLAAAFARMIVNSPHDEYEEYEELDEDGVPYTLFRGWGCTYTDNDYEEE